MEDNSIKQLKNYSKFIIYLLLAISMVVLALLLFKNSNIIFNTVSKTGIYNQIETEFYHMFLYMILLLVIPFASFFILTIVELSNIMGQLKYKLIEQKSIDSGLSDKKEDISEEEKLQKDKEFYEKIKNQYEEKEKAILEYLTENLTQDSKEHDKISESILSGIGKFYEIIQGELYLKQQIDGKEKLVLSGAYAYFIPEEKIFEFEIGEGLIGQVAKQGEPLNLNNIPEGYITVSSGLGSATPTNMLIFPIKKNSNGEVLGVIELASFKEYNEHDIRLFQNMGEKIGKYFKNINATKKQEK